MSWDIVIFKLSKTVINVEEIDETILVDIGNGDDFKRIVKDSFPNMLCGHDNWCKIETEDYSVEFSLNNSSDNFSNILIHLYGDKSIYAVVDLCKKNNWQAFDTSLGAMLNLGKPEENGYSNFQKYLNQIKQGS